MINEAHEWGDFSEWLIRVNECLKREKHMENDATPEPIPEVGEFMDAICQWVSKIKEAPVTTWREELSVRGYEFEWVAEEPTDLIEDKLWILLEALAGMRIFLTNTDHLSDEELYRFLVTEVLDRPVAQIAYEDDAGCVLDVVGFEVQDDPLNWLTYYANNRERMEWAKQNPGKGLPSPMTLPHERDLILPQP